MGKKILIVDDSSAIRQHVSFTLINGGFQVIEAVDGHDGIAKLKEHTDVVVIISDIHMPRMNGFDMIAAIRAEQQHASLPVVMLTSEGNIEVMERVKKAGAKSWLVKPFKAELLMAAVTKLAG